MASVGKGLSILSLIVTVLLSAFNFLAPPASASSPLHPQTRLAGIELPQARSSGLTRPVSQTCGLENEPPTSTDPRPDRSLPAPAWPSVTSHLSQCPSSARALSYDHSAIDSVTADCGYDLHLHNASAEVRVEPGPTLLATSLLERGPPARIFAGAGLPLAAEEGVSASVAPDLENLSSKILRQMEQRGWTSEEIQEAFDNGEQVNAVNKATGGAATRYINPVTGQSVVIDNATGEVIHVGGPGFRYGPGSGDVP